MPRKQITKEHRARELKDATEHIQQFLELIGQGKISFAKPLAVELRKLYCEGQGNELLKRIELDLNIKLVFKIRAEPRIPPTYKDSTIDEYLSEERFFYAGAREDMYTRKDIVKIIADQKGAHLDDAEDAMHNISMRINNLPITVRYLVEIATTTLRVYKNQIEKTETRTR